MTMGLLKTFKSTISSATPPGSVRPPPTIITTSNSQPSLVDGDQTLQAQSTSSANQVSNNNNNNQTRTKEDENLMVEQHQLQQKRPDDETERNSNTTTTTNDNNNNNNDRAFESGNSQPHYLIQVDQYPSSQKDFDCSDQSQRNSRDYELERQLLASHPPPIHHNSNQLLRVQSSDNIFKRGRHRRGRSASEVNSSNHSHNLFNSNTNSNSHHSNNNLGVGNLPGSIGGGGTNSNLISNNGNILNNRCDSPPPPSLRSGLPPTTFKDLAVLYQVVAERRNAFDNLLWQVPATSLTAHAFLFSISLAADTGRFARIASMGLCIIITVLTLHLFTRQLQAEDADHRWLTDFEERHQIDYYDRAHGARWKDYRAQKPAGAGRLGWLAMHRSYPLWSKGMIIIGLLACIILILAIFDQNILIGYNCQIN